MKQREIKFRVWDNKNKFMVSPELGEFIAFDGLVWKDADTKYDTPNKEIEPTADLVLIQFTGLLDLHGKEIYEGDVLDMITENSMSNMEVKYQDAQFVGEGAFNTCPLIEYVKAIDFIEWEISGNIYEHPNLLNPQP